MLLSYPETKSAADALVQAIWEKSPLRTSPTHRPHVCTFAGPRSDGAREYLVSEPLLFLIGDHSNAI